MKPRAAALATVAALCVTLLAPAGMAAQPASPVPSGPGDETLALRDLYLDMPYYLGGYEPDIVITRGSEHLDGLAPDDETRLGLEAFVESLGAGIEDMDSGYALVSTDDVFAFVVAIRVEGAPAGGLLPAYLPILLQDLVDPSTTTSTSGGKQVLVISSIGDGGEYVELSAYDQGDTIWLLQGPADIVEVALEGLPEPA